ncbi:MAG: integration host factor subunit beta [Tannerella sp.]|jgi:DNA-binding protein HU-beta|nr:integration host factor subunit beta [Tannerella sp.]
MTKAELISQISKSTGVDKSEILSVVTSYMETIKKSLKDGENVYLRGFGSFIIKKRAEKKARNISKNTTITIPAHEIPAFKPSKVFLESIAGKAKAKKKK